METISDYSFHPLLILRTPAYPYRNYKTIHIKQLLKSNDFIAAITQASKSLAQELEKVNYAPERLPGKVTTALEKYYNRMCFRPTPFGTMAGLSIVRLGIGTGPVIVGSERKIHILPGYREVVNYSVDIKENAPFENIYYRANYTSYRKGNELRYLRYKTNEDTGKRSFLINTAVYSELLDKVLTYCIDDRTLREITDFVIIAFGVSVEESTVFVNSLVEQQLLFCSNEPNITGQDYLERMEALSNTIEKTDHPLVPPYINLERPDVKGTLADSIQQKIKDGLCAIDKLIPYRPIEQLTSFKESFVKKFDQQTIPLMLALDPELGIGYQSLAGDINQPALLKNVDINGAKQKTVPVDWSPAHSYLMQKWTAISSLGEKCIRITKDELEQLHQTKQRYNLPPSTSILFRVKDKQVYLEQAGGASALSLIGRFTILNKDFLSIGASVAAEEENANPDVIFAEIAHFSDLHTANIERRAAIRKFEIPVLTGSAYDEQHLLALADLSVTVRNNEIILFATKQGKKVIPRLSSAFNHSKSDLAVFRFLCDLQHQGIKSNLGFDLRAFFPDLDYYPRVVCDDTILQLETWHVTKERITTLLAKNKGTKEKNVTALANALYWPRFISVNQGDNQLVFDLESNEDISLLSEFVKEGKELVIKEYPFTDEIKPAVKDDNGSPYINQFIASLYHNQQVYSPVSMPETPAESLPRQFTPGSEWLYFKLYCLPMRSNEIITQYLAPFTSQRVNKWFFIRYYDSEHHLRIRFRAENGTEIPTLFADFYKWFNPLVKDGLINRLMVDTYERELERYGPEIIEQVEDFFWGSSMIVTGFLQHSHLGDDDLGYYQIGFAAVQQMMDIFKYEFNDRIALFEMLYLSLCAEFNTGPRISQQMKDKYREISKWNGFDGLFTRTNSVIPKESMLAFTNSIIALEQLTQLWTAEKKRKLLADLLHMHLNRVFADLQRKQELVIYYCLWKRYISCKARNAKQALPLTLAL